MSRVRRGARVVVKIRCISHFIDGSCVDSLIIEEWCG